MELMKSYFDSRFANSESKLELTMTAPEKDKKKYTYKNKANKIQGEFNEENLDWCEKLGNNFSRDLKRGHMKC